jgi:hypothetical protein
VAANIFGARVVRLEHQLDSATIPKVAAAHEFIPNAALPVYWASI